MTAKISGNALETGE